MAHMRTQILHALEGALVAAMPSARVLRSSIYAVADYDLPCVLIGWSTDKVLSTDGVSAPRVFDRALEVVVRCLAEQNVGLDDALDEMCRQVEVAFASPCAALAGLAKDITPTGVTSAPNSLAEKPSGMSTLSYDVRYITPENAPDTSA